MGQGQSLRESSPVQVVMVHDKIQGHVEEFKQIVSLSYEQFLQSVDDLNKLTKSFSDVNGKQLIFQMRPGSDSTFLWKAMVRIRCLKANTRTGSIESSRILNLKQYIHLFNEINRQATVATLKAEDKTCDFTASMLLEQAQSPMEGDENECCICMDRRAEIILTCNHTYCEQCIDQWNLNHRNCPVCRTHVQGSDDTWVLTEKPDDSEMAYETTGYLMGLADRTGKPQ